jgi:predicted DNA-binding transcriptional regulator YafY
VVEPHRLVNWGRRWYLLAWDLDRADWRTFRVDRIENPLGVGLRFAEREPPGGDAAAYVRKGSRTAQWTFVARLMVHAPASLIAEKLGPVAESVEIVDENRCVVSLGAASAEALAPWLGFLGADFEVLDSPELAVQVSILANRYAKAPG